MNENHPLLQTLAARNPTVKPDTPSPQREGAVASREKRARGVGTDEGVAVGTEETAGGEGVMVDPEARWPEHWPYWAPQILDAMANGGFNLTAAALEVGVDRRNVHRLAARDPDFASAVVVARDACLDLIERRMTVAATRGIPRRETTTRTYPDGSTEVTVKEGADFVPTAGFFMLKRWRTEYRDTHRTELTGADGGPVRIESLDVIDRQIAELTAELERRGRPVEPGDLVARD